MIESRIGVDIGGTFTDVVAVDATGALRVTKLPTTPRNIADALARGTARVRHDSPAHTLLYGTTLATNALLEHRLAPIGLFVTAGFRDILEINGVHDEDHHEPSVGHHVRHRLVALEHVYELRERIEHDGSIRTALHGDDVSDAGQALLAANIEIVAVVLLHSFTNPRHERRVREILATSAPALRVVLSSEVLPELREYERAVTTCLNAALLPLLSQHLAQVRAENPSRLLIMKSSGGLSDVQNIVETPLATVLSGPSAAVVGMSWLAQQLKIRDFITLDVGGTSTDVALVRNGAHAVTTRAEVGGYPLKLPAVEVLTIGAGGGSLAYFGLDQRWHVGPESAGAEPGPVCYGRGGTAVTLTDAELALGRLPTGLLGGELRLEIDAANHALQDFGRARNLDAQQTAIGILKIATHNMCGAIRRVSVQRGHDPRGFALIAIGGAGPLHAAELAEMLGITTVVIPRHPGLAAAYGLLVADLREDSVQTAMQRETQLDVQPIAQHYAALEAQVAERLRRVDGSGPLVIARHADLRYRGMSAEFTVPVAGGPITLASLHQVIDAFHQTYAALSGHAYRGLEEVEIVNLRVTATAVLPKPQQSDVRLAPAAAPQTKTRSVYFLNVDAIVESPLYARNNLQAGSTISGPAVIEQFDTTILVPPGFLLFTDASGNAIIRSTLVL